MLKILSERLRSNLTYLHTCLMTIQSYLSLYSKKADPENTSLTLLAKVQSKQVISSFFGLSENTLI